MKICCFAVLLLFPLTYGYGQEGSNLKLTFLGLTSQAAVAADEYTTLQVTQTHSYRLPSGIIIVQPPTGTEFDPLARPFISLPRPAYYASGAALSGGLTYLSHRWRKEGKRWWWVPEAAQIAVNGLCAIHNARRMR